MSLNNNETAKTEISDDRNTILNKNNYNQKDKKEDSSKSENDKDKVEDTYENNENNKTYSSEEGKRYVNSSPMDIIRDLYSCDNGLGPETTKLDHDFIKNSQNYKIDEKYNNAIEEAEKNKKQVSPIKEYEQFDGMLATSIQSLLENTDKNGEISFSDLNDLFKTGPLKKTKDKLVNDLEKKNDKGEPAYSNEQRNFIKKVLELFENIENNNNFSFDGNSTKANLGNVFKSVWFNYQNLSFIKLIITVIHDFFSFSNSQKNTIEIMKLSEQIITDANEFYNIPFDKRQILINRMTKNLARIKYLLHAIPFIPNKATKSFKEVMKCVDEARSTKTSSADVLIDFIKAFGLKAIGKVSINSLNENIRKLIQNKLTKSIVNTYKNFNESEASNMADGILKCDETGRKFYLVDNSENIFYDGKVKKEYDIMSDKLEKTNEIEDLKIKCNTNLLKVEAIKKQTEQFIKSVNLYIVDNERLVLAKIKEKCALLDGAGANYSAENINSIIKGISDKVYNNINYSFENLKHLFYEYVDNSQERSRIIFSSKESFDEEKKNMEQTLKKCLCDSDGKPKNGKESDVLAIKDMISKMENIPEFAFKNCEKIAETIKKIQKDRQIKIKSSKSTHANNDLFKLASDKNVIENNLLHSMLDKGVINSTHHKSKHH